MSRAGRTAYLEQFQEYRAKLFAYRDETSIQTLKQLIELQIEDVKNKLLTASPDRVPPLQAEAYAYNSIIQWVTQPASRIPQKGEAS